jgi:hypothetical protein
MAPLNQRRAGGVRVVMTAALIRYGAVNQRLSASTVVGENVASTGVTR